MKARNPLVWCFVWALLNGVPALPQIPVMRGRVLDDAGSLVPGARITLRGTGGPQRNEVSGGNGEFVFAGVTPGDYTLAAAAPGLATPQPVSVRFDGEPQAIDLHVKIVTATAQITVQSDLNAVSAAAENNASATVVSGDDLQALSDNPDDLASDLAALAGPAAGPGGGAILVDGFSDAQIPPKESIREVRINQNPFSPEYDKLGIGRVEIFTKPGTDKYHAAVTYNYGTERWNTRNPYAAQKAPFLLNETENSAGGPLGRRSSFTLDVQRQWVDNGSVINAVTLDAARNPAPYTEVHLSPQRNLRIGPHVDYQLNANNYVSVRYLFGTARIEDAGIDDFELVSRGFHHDNRLNSVQTILTSLHGTGVNETRFSFLKYGYENVANVGAPAVLVLGAFSGGGATLGYERDVKQNFEGSNYTSILHGPHSWRFGVRVRNQGDRNDSQSNFNGTFTFTSIAQYRSGTPEQFSINAGVPSISLSRFDAGLFAGDDWRIRHNITLSAGLRYENQNNIHDPWNFAPRVGIAWAPGAAANRAAKTVLRGGFGMFYDRFSLANSLLGARYDGVNVRQYVATRPSFFPLIPAIATLAAGSAQSIRQLDASLRAPYVLQAAVTLERQLPGSTTLAVTYTNARSLHVLRSADINAPLPASRALPFPGKGPILLIASTGVYNQNQIIVNVNSKVSPALSIFGYYVLNRARSNSDGVNTFPANPYDDTGEYGRAAGDVRHRVLFGGTIATRGNFRLNPLFTVQSGAPFDITSGSDPYGTTLFTARPALVNRPAAPGLIQTPYGLLDPNPAPGATLLPRNAGNGPMQLQANLRITRTWGFGGERSAKPTAAEGATSTGPALTAPTSTRGLFANPTTPRRYNLTVGLAIRNLTNHNNPGPIVGNVTSPLFGRSNKMAGGANGEGFSENANNRRLELQLRFAF